MKNVVALIFLFVLYVTSSVSSQQLPRTNPQFGQPPAFNFRGIGVTTGPKKFQPVFSLQGAGGGKNLKNFNAGFNAGVEAKVWEKKHNSLTLGGNYGQDFARMNGQTFKSKPQYGFGATFKFGKK